VQQAAALGDGEHGQRVWHCLGADGGAFQRIDGDVDFRAVARADLLADVEHRRFVHLAFADDDGATDVAQGQFAAHGVDSGLVGGLLVAAATEARGGDGGCLGDARHFQNQYAFQSAVMRFQCHVPSLGSFNSRAGQAPRWSVIALPLRKRS
jgi:hypothetical protein